MSDITTIQLKKPTKKKLLRLGISGESTDTIVNKVSDFYIEKKGEENNGTPGSKH